MMLRILFVVSLFCILTRGELTENGSKFMKKIYGQCVTKMEMFKCFKIQGLKIINRALYSKALNIIDGITLVMDKRHSRKFENFQPLNETKLEKLQSEEIDNMIVDATSKFLDNHKLEFRIPRLVEEGRKKSKGQGNGALLWALAIKGTFLTMAYKGIAIMAGTAILVGKMALTLAAILGLKKLVSSGHEKTTVEIVKVPKTSETHTQSTSYEYEDVHHHRRTSDPIQNYGQRIDYYR